MIRFECLNLIHPYTWNILKWKKRSKLKKPRENLTAWLHTSADCRFNLLGNIGIEGTILSSSCSWKHYLLPQNIEISTWNIIFFLSLEKENSLFIKIENQTFVFSWYFQNERITKFNFAAIFFAFDLYIWWTWET